MVGKGLMIINCFVPACALPDATRIASPVMLY